MFILASFGFAAPALLAGALMVGLPLLAHFMNRKVRTRLVFPSLRLLSDVLVSRERVGAWRKWLLFLMRALAVVLLAAAFALPFWSRAPRIEASETDETTGATLVVIDASLSMERDLGGANAWEQALRSADDLLARAGGQGRRVQVLLAHGQPESLFPRFTANHPALRAELQNARPTASRADLPAALSQAARLLNEQPAPRALVLITDAQESNWREVLDAPMPPALAGVEITVIRTPDRPVTNLSVHTPRLEPRTPVPGQPARVRAQLQNHGDAPGQTPVTLRLNGIPVHTDTVTLSPRETREWETTLHIDDEGLHALEIEIGPDEFAPDNITRLVARVRSHPGVILVTREPPDRPGTATYHLIRALAPHGDERDRWMPRVLQPGELSTASLADAPVLWTVGDLDLAPRERELLAQRAETLGWIQWMDGQTEPAPATTPFRLREDRDAAELLPGFDPAARDTLSRVPLTRRAIMEAEEGERVALRFRDGVPALAWRETAGGGRVVRAAFSPARADGGLGSAAVWVALVHALMEAMPDPQDGGGFPVAGESVALHAHDFRPGGGEPVLRGPDGRRLLDTVFLLEGRTLGGTAPVARQTGVYTLHQGERLLDKVAVNPDPRESDFRPVAAEVLANHLQSEDGPATRTASTGDPADDLFPDDGLPLWGWAFLLAILLLSLESTLLARWRT
ncbi:MAG: BatA domain-containing protein [Verrucomicrobia bacterium]|nr:BatA domain-containing protein [Verrucomicrobiota bacterium]MCH8513266.1 BatA domain-containing protein [Kiritimatiellia bacterium]